MCEQCFNNILRDSFIAKVKIMMLNSKVSPQKNRLSTNVIKYQKIYKEDRGTTTVFKNNQFNNAFERRSSRLSNSSLDNSFKKN